MGTPNREPQEYSRNILECKDPGRYIPIIFLLLVCAWGSLFGIPIKVPLTKMSSIRRQCPPIASLISCAQVASTVYGKDEPQEISCGSQPT